MKAADLWIALKGWIFADAWLAWAALALFWLLCVGMILCLVAMLRRELPMHQWAEDDDQIAAITRPASLEKPTHQVHIQPASNVIPWERRVRQERQT
jgi:hypothetical protein